MSQSLLRKFQHVNSTKIHIFCQCRDTLPVRENGECEMNTHLPPFQRFANYIANLDYQMLFDLSTVTAILVTVAIVLGHIFDAMASGFTVRHIVLFFPLSANTALALTCHSWASGSLFRVFLVISALFNVFLFA